MCGGAPIVAFLAQNHISAGAPARSADVVKLNRSDRFESSALTDQGDTKLFHIDHQATLLGTPQFSPAIRLEGRGNANTIPATATASTYYCLHVKIACTLTARKRLYDTSSPYATLRKL